MNRNLRPKTVVSIAILFLCGILTGCAANEEPLSRTGFYFDTVIQITLYDFSDETVLDGCFALAEKYENMLSATKENSDVFKINHSGGAPVEVTADTAELLETALYYAELTDGKIDPTILPVAELWNFGSDKTPAVPDPSSLEEALSHVDYHTIHVVTTGDSCTVTLRDPQTMIDLGFIAKGYIADRMKAYLLSEGISSACINLGGNVVTIGDKPDGSPFRIGVQEPFAAEGTPITVVSLSDGSLVSSGVYERYFYQDDILYHHILDPATGYPVDNNLAGVTILSPGSVEGDALSTTCYCLGLDDGMKLIESLENVEAVFITKDNALHYSSGFPQH